MQNATSGSQSLEKPKNYGSARAYAQEVRKWYNYTQFMMACQHLTALQNLSMQVSQQYAALTALNSTQQVVLSFQYFKEYLNFLI